MLCPYCREYIGPEGPCGYPAPDAWIAHAQVCPGTYRELEVFSLGVKAGLETARVLDED